MADQPIELSAKEASLIFQHLPFETLKAIQEGQNDDFALVVKNVFLMRSKLQAVIFLTGRMPQVEFHRIVRYTVTGEEDFKYEAEKNRQVGFQMLSDADWKKLELVEVCCGRYGQEATSTDFLATRFPIHCSTLFIRNVQERKIQRYLYELIPNVTYDLLKIYATDVKQIREIFTELNNLPKKLEVTNDLWEDTAWESQEEEATVQKKALGFLATAQWQQVLNMWPNLEVEAEMVEFGEGDLEDVEEGEETMKKTVVHPTTGSKAMASFVINDDDELVITIEFC